MVNCLFTNISTAEEWVLLILFRLSLFLKSVFKFGIKVDLCYCGIFRDNIILISAKATLKVSETGFSRAFSDEDLQCLLLLLCLAKTKQFFGGRTSKKN